MSFEFATLHGTFTDFPPRKHECRLPHDADDWPPHDPENRPTHWTCNDCGQVYKIEYTGWTGWWSPDTTFDAERGEGEFGMPTIFCQWETWHDCMPNVTFRPRKPNNLGVSGISMADPFPGKRPEWLPPLPVNKRPYVSQETRRKMAKAEQIKADKEAAGLFQVSDIPPAPPRKKRRWLLNG